MQDFISSTRRNLLKSLAATSLLAASPSLFARTLADNQNNILTEGWFSAQGSTSDLYGFAGQYRKKNHSNSKNYFSGLMGFRGHGGTQHPIDRNRILLFGRRPSTESVEIDLQTGQVSRHFSSGKNRHFFGHGAFSLDGKYLFTSEADLQTNVGKIGIRDAKTYQKLGEFDTYGVGPHQLCVMLDGKNIVVANGGILTRPETGRKQLNLDIMQSNLSYVDIESGDLIEQVGVAESKASIRHIDVAEDGSVAIAMQMQRQACKHQDIVALTAIHKSGQPIRLLSQPEMLIEQMNDYVGSVAIHPTSRIAGFTSPRGNVVGFWDIDTGEYKGYHALRDVCGIATQIEQSSFVITNSNGLVKTLDAHSLVEKTQLRKHYPQYHWDNHMISIKKS